MSDPVPSIASPSAVLSAIEPPSLGSQRSSSPGLSFDSPSTPSSSRPGPRRLKTPASDPKRQQNREAQRAHRRRKQQHITDLEAYQERRERYVQDLEYEVTRLRQQCIAATTERHEIATQCDKLNESNQHFSEVIDVLWRSPQMVSRLDTLLDLHFGKTTKDAEVNGISSRTNRLSLELGSGPQRQVTAGKETETALPPSDIGTLDYDTVALDFVLTLERPCMKHVHFLVARAHDPAHSALHQRPDDVPDDGKNEKISGHALMASCPPLPPFEPYIRNDERHSLTGVDKASLSKLLGMCEKLPGLAERELPPIKAWVRLKEDERFPRLSAADFRLLRKRLLPAVQCYR